MTSGHKNGARSEPLTPTRQHIAAILTFLLGLAVRSCARAPAAGESAPRRMDRGRKSALARPRQPPFVAGKAGERLAPLRDVQVDQGREGAHLREAREPPDLPAAAAPGPSGREPPLAGVGRQNRVGRDGPCYRLVARVIRATTPARASLGRAARGLLDALAVVQQRLGIDGLAGGRVPIVGKDLRRNRP